MKCAGKVAVVTGAAGMGIGRSIALTLAREGAAVAVNYRLSRDQAEAIAEAIRKDGGRAAAVPGDVFTREGCETLMRQTQETLGGIDICVVGPGAGWNPEGIAELNAELSLEDAHRELSPVYHLLPLALQGMTRAGWGRIIAISSNMEIASPSYSYNVSKSARTQALLQAAPHAWQWGVTVNVIAPGPVEPIATLGEAFEYSKQGDAWAQRGRVTPQDIAEGVAFLCSEEARYITGCVLPYRF